MHAIASVQSIRTSVRKMQPLMDHIRGKRVDEALTLLRFAGQKNAHVLAKLLASAIANAEHNGRMDRHNLLIKSIVAEQGATLKRFQPRAFGRAYQIRRRTCHVKVVLSEIKPTMKAPEIDEAQQVAVPAPAGTPTAAKS